MNRHCLSERDGAEPSVYCMGRLNLNAKSAIDLVLGDATTKWVDGDLAGRGVC